MKLNTFCEFLSFIPHSSEEKYTDNSRIKTILEKKPTEGKNLKMDVSQINGQSIRGPHSNQNYYIPKQGYKLMF